MSTRGVFEIQATFFCVGKFNLQALRLLYLVKDVEREKDFEDFVKKHHADLLDVNRGKGGENAENAFSESLMLEYKRVMGLVENEKHKAGIFLK